MGEGKREKQRQSKQTDMVKEKESERLKKGWWDKGSKVVGEEDGLFCKFFVDPHL